MSETQNNELFGRTITLRQITLISLGTMIGAPIFLIPGIVIAETGTLAIVSFLICGFIALLIGLSYSELATTWMSPGGGYEYVKEGFGGLPAYFDGLAIWLCHIALAALSAIGFSYSLGTFIPNELIMPMALVVVIIFLVINIFGGGEGSVFTQVILTALLIGTFVIFIIFGIPKVQFANFSYYPPNVISNSILTLPLVFSTYIGFEIIASMSEEVQAPYKTIPRSFVFSLLITIGIYIGIVVVLIGSMSPQQIANSSTPVIDSARYLLGDAGYIVLVIGGIIACLTSLNAAFIASARNIYALALDRRLPLALCRSHKKYNTPYVALMFNGCVILFITVSGLITLITHLISLGFVLNLVLINISIFKTRKKRPNVERPFKIPFFPYSSIIATIICVVLSVLTLVSEPASFIVGFAFFMFVIISYYLKTMGLDRIRIALSGMTFMSAGFVVILVFFFPTLLPYFFARDQLLTTFIYLFFIGNMLVISILLFIDISRPHLVQGVFAISGIIISVIIMIFSIISTLTTLNTQMTYSFGWLSLIIIGEAVFTTICASIILLSIFIKYQRTQLPVE